MRFRRLFLIVISAALFVVSPVAAQTTDVTLDQYTQLMREAYAAAQRNDEIGLREAADKIVPTRTVSVPSGEKIPVDNTWLAQALDTNTPNLRQIAEQLGAIVESLTAGRLNSPADLEKLRTILSNPPFAELQPQAPQPATTGWLNFFSGDFVTGCLTFLAIVFVTGMAVYIILAFRRGMVREVKKATASDADVDEIRGMSSTTAIEKADQVATVEADFRKAVRYLYLSTLLWLEERGVLRYDRTLTNREVLSAVRPNAMLHQRLSPVVQTFDSVWYGFDEIDQTAFESFRQQVTTLREGR
ncbi:MAG: DUF4129 domain-containing protein [Herpetosiphon sp.]|nr:DUF4129 domain-containing protein [Herpetosiphon sp.]